MFQIDHGAPSVILESLGTPSTDLSDIPTNQQTWKRPITSQMAPQRRWVSSDSKYGLRPKGSRRSACRYPLSPRALRDAGNSSSKARQTTVGKRAGMEVWFTPSLGGKSPQAVSFDLVIDEVDDVAPDMVSAEELVAKFYEPALVTHWEHGASTWSPSSLIWAAAEENDTLEPNDSISHSTKTQGR